LSNSVVVHRPSNSYGLGGQLHKGKGTIMDEHVTSVLLTPAEVAKIFRVNPKTVTRWARSGRISAVRTLGGHRRFRADDIRRLLGEEYADRLPAEEPDQA
jgi:excisionase family DNA binding protein